MPARSDFEWVTFDETFTAASPSHTRQFGVEGNPVRNAYLLIQVFGVNAPNHEIFINGNRLTSFDVPPHAGNQWITWMDGIPYGFLQSGGNDITIRRTSNDDFRVANVVISWRELD